MESLLATFNYGSTPVRTVEIDNEPWFVAADVCAVLDLSKTDRAVASLDDDEKGTHTVSTPGGNQNVTVINESGLYSLVLRSRKPEAKTFKRWITHEVLPAIRKTGQYAPAQVAPAPVAVVSDEVMGMLSNILHQLSCKEEFNRMDIARVRYDHNALYGAQHRFENATATRFEGVERRLRLLESEVGQRDSIAMDDFEALQTRRFRDDGIKAPLVREQGAFAPRPELTRADFAYPLDTYFTIAETAKLLGVDWRRIEEFCNSGLLGWHRDGRKRKIAKNDLVRFLRHSRNPDLANWIEKNR